MPMEIPKLCHAGRGGGFGAGVLTLDTSDTNANVHRRAGHLAAGFPDEAEWRSRTSTRRSGCATLAASPPSRGSSSYWLGMWQKSMDWAIDARGTHGRVFGWPVHSSFPAAPTTTSFTNAELSAGPLITLTALPMSRRHLHTRADGVRHMLTVAAAALCSRIMNTLARRPHPTLCVLLAKEVGQLGARESHSQRSIS